MISNFLIALTFYLLLPWILAKDAEGQNSNQSADPITTIARGKSAVGFIAFHQQTYRSSFFFASLSE